MNALNEADTALLLNKITRKEHSCSIDAEETCYPNPSNIDTLLRHWSQMQQARNKQLKQALTTYTKQHLGLFNGAND
jgi:uncharacterized protein (UPF0332 family)